jgi:hypothetical protein
VLDTALANSVYLQTQQGLAAMVSDRAASRVLDAVLRGSRIDRNSVTAEQMSSLLLGPVLQELVSILPRQGLELNLETLAASLLVDSMFLDQEPVAAAIPAPQPAAAAVPAWPRPRSRAVITGVNTRPLPVAADPRRLDAAVLTLAAIDHVTLIAAVKSDGSVHVSRGVGNVGLLARFGMLALRLLERGGRLRSYYLEHDEGFLFLFPFNEAALLLLGNPHLNIRTVFTVFSELTGTKEQP